ncbi:MAG: hypothetical protein WC676_02495 [Candidatus Omnitrophota bacterium]
MNVIKIYFLKTKSYLSKRKIPVLLLLSYLAVITLLSCNHIVWRDEVRALSLGIESRSLSELSQKLHNEGTPIVWYAILYAGFFLTQSTLILKIASIAIAACFAYVFFFKAPFSWPQKALFLFGFYPVYQYSVICRNYGIGVLLLFLFCALYPKRFEKIILTSIVLALFANTSAHSLIIAFAIFLSMLAEWIFLKEEKYKQVKVFIGFLIIAVGIAFSAFQIYPDKTTVASQVFQLTPLLVAKAGFNALVFPGEYFFAALGFQNIFFGNNVLSALLTSIVIWLMYVLLFRKPFVLSFFFMSITALGMFSQLVYKFHMHHQGFLLILLVAVLWLDHPRGKEVNAPTNTKWLGLFIEFLSKYKSILLYILLILQVVMAGQAVYSEYQSPFSSSKKLSELLRQDLSLKDAIVIGEPDYAMDSLPYYVNNQIFIPRERRFGKAVQFTKENEQAFSLGGLLETAQEIKNKLQRPVIIALGHDLKKDTPYRFFGYNKVFVYSPEQLRRLSEQTRQIASFRGALTDENYDIFIVK